jgi:choline-sulfatase
MGGADRSGITREDLLKSAALAGGSLLVGRAPLAAAKSAKNIKGMNVLVFLTDQDRAIQHFPAGWAKKNLPGYSRLLRNGLSFDRAFTNACMCSPARSTLMTGYFPAQHGVKYTLESDMPSPKYPQVELSTKLANLATVTLAAGYHPVYKGKFHCVKAAGSEFTPADVAQYGFARWNPPDAGANQDISECGGGSTDNDGRYMNDEGAVTKGDEGVLDYLRSQAAKQQPFFLVVSLVNPHDVLMYPKNATAAGYDDSWLDGDIRLPETVDEDLSTKPKAHAQFVKLFNLTGKLSTPAMKRNYLNFYGNLMKSSDNYLVDVLDTLQDEGLFDDTLVVRTADHGEMGVSHGGMRQKNFNFYEESVRVPLVYSNPRLFPKPKRSQALVSHVDFLPTLASLVGAPRSARSDWEGVDYSGLVLGTSSRAPQDYVVFTYDDFQAGQASGPYIPPPNHIVSIRERRWKLAKYYDANGKVPFVYEMYDLQNDPLERKNLTYSGYTRTAEQEKQFQRLRRRLDAVQKSRLKPL